VSTQDNNEARGLRSLFPRQQEEGQPQRKLTVMVAAFEGWNDAGEAATDAVKYLSRIWDGRKVASIDPDLYYDFQFTRPMVRRTASGERRIKWPTTKLTRCSVPGTDVDVVFVHGVEPSYRWRAYTAELLAHATEQDVDCLILVGALLADVPHSRPIPVTATSEDDGIREALNTEPSQYEGPTGIVGVLSELASLAGIPTVSLWAAVPHYVGQAPSPKAELALLHRLEDILQLPLDTSMLTEEAEAWERGVNELAVEDPEVAAYVHQLEEAKDTAELPDATGESIAREFERYLKKRRKD
jgi:PAC2 family